MQEKAAIKRDSQASFGKVTVVEKQQVMKETQQTQPNYWISSNRRYVLYAIICLAYLSNGIDLAIISPSLEDLRELMNISKKEFTTGLSIKCIGNCIASILAGITFSKFNRQFQYTLAICTYGVLTIYSPHMRGVTEYYIGSALFGISSSYIDVATNVWILELFSDGNVNLYVQIVHFVFAIGQITGPLMVNPYLATPIEFNSTTEQHEYYLKHSHISIPFAIGGSFFIACSIAMLACWLYKPYIAPDRSIDGKDVQHLMQEGTGGIANPVVYAVKDNSNMDVHSNGNGISTASMDPLCVDQLPSHRRGYLPTYYYVLLIFIIQCVNALEVSCESNFNYFLATYLGQGPQQLDKHMCAYMATMVGVGYTVGRFSSIFITPKGVHRNVYGSVMLLLLCNVLIYICPLQRMEYLTPLMFFFGIGFSSLFPSMLVFVEQRINITNKLNASMLAISTTLFSINSWAIGEYMNSTPQMFLYLNAAYPALFFILFVALHGTDFLKRRLLNKQD